MNPTKFNYPKLLLLGAEYVVSGPGQGDFTIRLNINAMFASTN